MIDFYDLARSGTAPEASKNKSSQVAASTFSARPKTRSVDNDVQDFNIDLRTNKPSYPQHIYEEDVDYYSRSDLGHNEELLQAIESFQADLEDWSGRKDYDAPAPNSFAIKQPTTATGGRRPSRDGRKSAHSSAVSAYTQNVPQIVLQTSKKGTKSQTASPRAAREPKPDLRADIRAVYGADILDKAAPTQRPQSQKPNSQNTGTSHHKVSDEAIPLSPERGASHSGYDHDEDYNMEEQRDPGASATGARPSSSASRLRSHVSASSQAQASAHTQSATAAAAAAAVKPFSVRKAAGTSSTSQRQATVPRPFSHSEVRPTTQGTSTRPPTVDSAANAGSSAVASSTSKKTTSKKAPSSAVNPLLKSSLAPSSSRGKYDVASRSSDIDSDGTGESLHVPPRASEYKESSRMAAEYPPDRYEHVPAGAPSAMESFVKERASTANAKAPSSRKPQGDASGSASNGAMYSYTHSAGVVGTSGLGSTSKRPPATADSREATSTGGANAAPSYASGSSKGYSSRDPIGRSISRSPTSDLLGLTRPDSDVALVDFIQDTDIMESSFDESPILAAYLQQKSNAIHKSVQSYETGETRKDGAGRPQSRKLYLGADKEGDDTNSPSATKSYKTAPRSAGARYAAPDSPALQVQSGADGHHGLRKMSSFSELVSPTRKWNDAGSQLPDLRPPSRQSSAFPVHLADEPPGTSSSAARHAETLGATLISKSAKVASPTSKSTLIPPKKASSMQWNRNDNVEDEVDEPYEEEVPDKHSDAEVDSNPTSESDSPRGRKGGPGVSSAQAVLGSSMTSVLTNMSAGTVNTATSLLAATAASAAAAAGASAVIPTREHIGIVRAPVVAEEASPIDYPTYELQRPPSRQKFAAPQHLFEGPPPPTRAGTEKETTRSKVSVSSAAADFRAGGQGSCPEQNSDAAPSSRSNTARPTTHAYNPRDDGFADLEYGDEPFVIHFNSNSSPEKSAYVEQFETMHSQSRTHRRSYNSLTGGSGTVNPGHSRSSSSASNSNCVEPDGMLSPLSSLRPQTVAHAGVGKTTRLLGVIPSTSSKPNPVQPLRGKSAGEGLKSPAGVPLHREGNNFLVMSQQPHAPSQQAPTSAMLGRGSGYGKVGEYTAGPPASGRTHGWTDGESSGRNPRTQNVKIVENSHGYDTGYTMTPSASSYALQNPAAMHTRSASHSPSNPSDACDSDDDDMTILTEDSGKHNMEAGMSMHSLALDSSLGEDFLSLFAPGP